MNQSQRERARLLLAEVGALHDDDGAGDAALFEAYRRLTDRVTTMALGACDEADPWPERVRSGLEALLGLLSAEPRVATLLTRGFPGIDAETYRCYVELLARFVPAMRAGRDYAEIDQALPDSVELLAVGAAEALIFSEVDAGRAEGLPQRLPEILFTILVPFIGPERASEEMQSAAAAS